MKIGRFFIYAIALTAGASLVVKGIYDVRGIEGLIVTGIAIASTVFIYQIARVITE